MVSTSSQVSTSAENNTRETTRNVNENDDVPPPSYSPPPYSPGEYGRRLQQVERASIRRRLGALIDLTRRQQERMSSRVARSTRVEESGTERVTRSRPRVKITLRGNRSKCDRLELMLDWAESLLGFRRRTRSQRPVDSQGSS